MQRTQKRFSHQSICRYLTHFISKSKFKLEELINLHRGQGFDIYWRDNNQSPSEDEYKQMVMESKYFQLEFFNLKKKT
jgi:hypothetical protein